MTASYDSIRLFRYKQVGLTLVELLVALVISLLIALAAISSLTLTRRGFNTVDASSQLRDNSRFATDILQRIAVQTGFKDYYFAGSTPTATEIAANIEPNVSGFNNARISSTGVALNAATSSRTSGSLGYGSDVLVLRYQEAETVAGSGVSDQSMIDCTGNSTTGLLTNRNNRADRSASVFHVAESPAGSGELALMCSTVASDGTISTAQPIVQGVENFQVLFGTDGVTAGAAPTIAADSVPDQYLRADQLTVAGDDVATNNNWRRVRSLRIGLVLRGPAGSSQERVAQTLYPFGTAKASDTAAAGSALSATTDDPGTVFAAPADGRLRQVVTFTVHLRNDQSL